MRLGDLAVLVDQVGDALRVLVLRSGRRAVREADGALGVAEQREVELVLLRELCVVFGVVEARAEDLNVFRRELAVEVPEPGTFERSAGCVGLRIEPEHDLAAAVVGEPLRAAGVVFHFEIGSGIARLEHLASSAQHVADRSGQ